MKKEIAEKLYQLMGLPSETEWASSKRLRIIK